MKRFVMFGLVGVLAFTVASCESVLDQMDLSQEDREALEDLADGIEEAINEANNGGDGSAPGAGDGDDGSGGDGSEDGAEEPDPRDTYDPDWSPASFPPPPGEPDRSMDYTGEGSCDPSQTCGWASYDQDDGEAIRDHYEQEFGRGPDEQRSFGARDEDGNPYDATTDIWRDGDTEVSVYTDHNGTDVHVKSAEG